MTLNKAPHYEAIGRCVFLKEKIKSLIQSLENRLSHIHELGIAYSAANHLIPKGKIFDTNCRTDVTLLLSLKHHELGFNVYGLG